jgi:hypothetical protein
MPSLSRFVLVLPSSGPSFYRHQPQPQRGGVCRCLCVFDLTNTESPDTHSSLLRLGSTTDSPFASRRNSLQSFALSHSDGPLSPRGLGSPLSQAPSSRDQPLSPPSYSSPPPEDEHEKPLSSRAIAKAQPRSPPRLRLKSTKEEHEPVGHLVTVSMSLPANLTPLPQAQCIQWPLRRS